MAQELVIGEKVIKPGTMIKCVSGDYTGQMVEFKGIKPSMNNYSGQKYLVKVQSYLQHCSGCKTTVRDNLYCWYPFVVGGTIREVTDGADITIRLAEYWEKYAQSWIAYLSHIKELTDILRDDAVTPEYYQDVCRDVFEDDRRAEFLKHTERLFALKREYSDVL
jgi:hypothetical protein